MDKLGVFSQDWSEMPDRVSFDELLRAPGFYNYVERYGRWRVILRNGVFYRQSRSDPEVGNKCEPDEMLDKCTL